MTLKLVVDNTPLVPKQPFKEPVEISRDELEEDRAGFDGWFKGEARQQFETWMKEKLKKEDEEFARRFEDLLRSR